ncbi:5-hydroxyisourate hydrolase [Geodermatophilus obscurus]|uniref:5-hydroxyisourate hydrolase n=1 Tax=Geodermatophilus obscurus TaxID=1861 RepID=A0A1M7USU2_9ACTN|nr:hydroxyisourate hydrolase [Geodermatophilus obscurus]SHN85987.1 5-hydroxyisourate hydrolase [Geodermatophilus obscurus]
MSSLSTHVLDAVSGQPAVGVRVSLERRVGEEWRPLGDGVTDVDGRLRDLAPDGLDLGAHRLVFATGEYFAATGQTGFYPEVTVAFTVTEDRHYHVPLLLSPYAFSTYRGS